MSRKQIGEYVDLSAEDLRLKDGTRLTDDRVDDLVDEIRGKVEL